MTAMIKVGGSGKMILHLLTKEKMIQQYEAGYRHHPESIEEIRALEELSADTFLEDFINQSRPPESDNKGGV